MDITVFLFQAMWNPLPQTWIKSIDAVFSASWPGLLSSLVKNYLDEFPETDKEHQIAARNNVRSTKPSNPLACNEMTTQTARKMSFISER